MPELPHPDEFVELNQHQRAMALLRSLDASPKGLNGRENIVSGEVGRYWPGSSLNHFVRGGAHSPVALQEEYMQAVQEAFDALLRDSLIARDALQRSENWVVVTDLGRTVREQQDDGGLRAIEARKLLSIPLHERLERARRAFLDGDHEGAVQKAIRAVEIAVRDAGGYGSRDIGKDLMMKAWTPGGPLADPELLDAEQDGIKFLFAGAVGAFKNPTSHREVDYQDSAEVAEIVVFADLLLRLTDRAAARRRA